MNFTSENVMYDIEVELAKRSNEEWSNADRVLLKAQLHIASLQRQLDHKDLTDEKIIEGLAELEHDQWMSWADSIMKSEKISDNRFARWASLMIPYSELSEEMKEHDRVWARKALAILRKAQEK